MNGMGITPRVVCGLLGNAPGLPSNVHPTFYTGDNTDYHMYELVGELRQEGFIDLYRDGVFLGREGLNGVYNEIYLGFGDGAGASHAIADIASFSFAFAPVPEQSTCIAGASLLLPFGVATIRNIRKKRTA